MVSAKGDPRALARSIATVFAEKRNVELRAIGVRAVSVAVKATVLARNLVLGEGLDFVVIPAFQNPRDNRTGGKSNVPLYYSSNSSANTACRLTFSGAEDAMT